jgi:hypothetical protein
MTPAHAIQSLRQPISWCLVALGVAVPTALHASASFALDVPGRGAYSDAPGSVHAGVPFVVRDGYATQLCISSHSGRALLPFVVSAGAVDNGMQLDEPRRVAAGIPFTVEDGIGTTLCVSTRGGQPLPPFVVP